MTGVTSRSQNARSRSRIAALVVGQLLVEQVEVRHAPECATVAGVDLRSAVEAGWEHQVELLRELVRAPSTLGNEWAAQEIVADELRSMGLEPDVWDVTLGGPGFSPPLIDYAGRPNVTAVLPGSGGGRSLTFNGHIDVVPATPEHHWTHDPWGAEIADGRMYGRGAADMKAGVVAMLGAVRVLRDAGLRGDIRIETVIEEECTGNGAAACRARGPRTDAALIPEPFNHAALEAQVGVLWARVTIEGKAAHAERADQAENAAVKALPVIEAIQALEAEVNARLRDAPELQRRRRARRRLGLVGPRGVRARGAPGGGPGRGPRGGQGALRVRRRRARRVARLPRPRLRDRARRADLRDAGERAPRRPRHRAGVPARSPARPTRARSSSTTPRRPRATARSAPTCTRRTSGSTWRACKATTLVLALAAAEWCR